MAIGAGLEDLVGHIMRTTRLSSTEAERLVAEIVAYFSETPEQFVIRRHAELQAEDHRNPAIFERIGGELASRRFAAPALTPRQIRRLIYG